MFLISYIYKISYHFVYISVLLKSRNSSQQRQNLNLKTQYQLIKTEKSMKNFSIPDSFQSREYKINHHKMKLYRDQQKIGSLTKSHKSGRTTYELRDLKKNIVAYADKKQFELGSMLQIYDMFGGLMGTIQRVILNPTINPLQKYSIFDGYGRLLASSKQQNEIQKSLALFNVQDIRAFSMRRRLNKFKDNWHVDIGQGIDKRLAVFLPIYVSDQLDRKL